MIEQNWSEEFTVGVEEELMILDAETFEQRPEVETLVAESKRRGLDGELKTELFASVVELATGICETPAQALDQLGALRRAGSEIAAPHGLALAGAGAHPFSRATEQTITPDPRYQEFVDYAGTAARRQGVSGLHVHVGMPDGETCLRVLETILPWLPVVLAVSANSPWFEGEESGMMSTRAEILALLPRRGAPPRFESWTEWQRYMDRVIASGLVKGYTSIWWDVRAHPTFGTLEIRSPDQPTALASTGAFVELLHALCTWAVEQPPPKADATLRSIYDQNRWAGSRFGPRAKLIHPERDGAAVLVSDLYAELAERIGFSGRPDAATCEGDRQLEIGRSEGLRAVCADLAARSVA